MDENPEHPQKHSLPIEEEEEADIKRRKLNPQLFSDLSDDQLVHIFGGEGLRFELCHVFLTYQRQKLVVADLQLFGTIRASAGAGGFSTDPLLQQYLFNREFNNPIHLPSSGHRTLRDLIYSSLPVSSTSVVQIVSKLYVTTDKVDDVEDYTDDPEPEPAEPEPDDIYISPEEMEEINRFHSEMSSKPASTVDKNEMSLEPASTVDKNEMSSKPASTVDKNEMSSKPASTVDTDEMSLEPASTVNTDELTLEHDSTSTVEKKQDMICIDDDDADEAENEALNEAFHVSDGHAFINISDKPNGGAGCSILEGKHGSLEMYYVVTKYAVDAELEVLFKTTNAAHTKVCGSVRAYYGQGFDYDDPDNPDDYYHAYLFDSQCPCVTPGRINLIRSVLAVPAKSSLIIEAKLRNHTIKGQVDIMSEKVEFPVPIKCCSLVETIVGDECSLELNVNWKLPSEEAKIRSSLNSSVSRLTERRKFEAHSTSTTADPDERNRWSLQKEIAKVFTTSLKRTFNLQEDVPCGISTCIKEDGGDYLCSSVMHIWPEIKNTRVYKGPKHAGVAVKNDIIGSGYKYMMESCVVCGPGFVKFKLHRKWIAERISTMVRVGIETWAPKLSVKKVIIYLLSEKEMHMSHLRSTFIGETLARMLEYSGVVVLRKRIHDGDSMDGLIQKRYQTVYQRLGINVKEEDKSFYESYTTKVQDLVREKGLLIGSEGDELPLVDLTVLWHALKEEKADWILYVSDVGKRVYIEMCITAAKRVGLIENDHSTCPLSHVGFGLVHGDETKSSSTKVVNLVNLLDEAESQCKALLVKQAGERTAIEPEHAKALGYGAVKYADLKNNRLTNYTFSVDQMLNEEGNTVVNLHFTHARICSIIRNSSKDIEKLTAEALILKHDNERELGLHLLQFTEVLGEVCISLTPHCMCDYLYGLCKKFNSLGSSVRQVVGSSDEASKLLLCGNEEML